MFLGDYCANGKSKTAPEDVIKHTTVWKINKNFPYLLK